MEGMLQRLFEKRWMIVGFLVAGWALGMTLSWILPPKYRSETVILVEQQKVPEHYVESNITADLQQRLQSMSEQILSRTRLLALIDKFNLYGGRAGRRDPDALVARMRKDITIEMISAEGRPDQLAAFKVSYSAMTPRLARDITQELTSLFINENLKNREQQSEDTTSFLQNQLDEARQSLTEQEEKLRQFRTQHAGELPEQLQSNLQILGGLQIQLQAATDALSQTEQRNLYLRSLQHQYQTTATQATTDGTGAGGPPTTQAELARLRAELTDLQGRYTDRYPDILRVKQEIVELEAKQAATGSAKSDATTNSSTAAHDESSPIMQLRSELSANEFQIQKEKDKIRRLEQQVELYQARLNATPDREQQAAAVTRDYDQSRSYYETLLSKKLQSEMATNLEKRRQGEQFQMIDPPSLPAKPYWPNRLACSLGGLALGLALGVVIAVLVEMVKPTIYDASDLVEVLGPGYVLALPVFATEQEMARARRRRIREAIAAGILAAAIPALTIVGSVKH